MRTVRCSDHLLGGLLSGGSAQEGCLSARRGVCLLGGVCQTHPPVNRMTDRCKNITLPQLRCGR